MIFCQKCCISVNLNYINSLNFFKTETKWVENIYTLYYSNTKCHSLLSPFFSTGDTFSSVLFSHSVMTNSLWPHESQHARPPCPSLTPRVYSNPCPSSRWCHPAISSFVVPFSSFPQFLPASEYFPVGHLFAWGGQSIGVSASVSVLPMNIQDWFPLEWTGWISLQSKGLSRVFSNTTVQSIKFLALSFLHSPTLTSIHDHWKNHSMTRRTFVGKVMSLLFNMLSRLVITFLPRSKPLFTSWLQSPSAVILEPIKIKSATVSTISPSISHEVIGCHDLSFLNVEL